MIKKLKKKIKLLLTKEEGKISKLALGIGSALFFSIEPIFPYSLNNVLFNINGNPIPQHIHNVKINIGTNPEDINFNLQINNTCLLIGEVGGSGSCGGVYWKDVVGGYNTVSSNSYICEGNTVSKICRAKGNKNDYGYVKYEWHNNDPNFNCNSYYGTFKTEVYTSSNQRVNTWKNVI
ncbi:MAG: hypothetical protein ABGW69_01050 [Nanoarchaeota archaeon]